MEKLKKMMLMGLMVLGCMTFGACGDDDDNSGEQGGNGTEVTVTKPEIKETANQLVLTYTMVTKGGSCNVKWTCDFEGDKLVKSIMTQTFSKESDARASFEAYKADPEDAGEYSLNGKTITVDNTEQYKGESKQVIKMTMEAIKAQYTK